MPPGRLIPEIESSAPEPSGVDEPASIPFLPTPAHPRPPTPPIPPNLPTHSEFPSPSPPLTPPCHKLHLAISPSILHRFSWSQWLRKALEKTFRSVLVTSRGDQ